MPVKTHYFIVQALVLLLKEASILKHAFGTTSLPGEAMVLVVVFTSNFK